MRRLTIFAKGNVDVHDSLVYSRVNGKIQWNGLNTLLAERHPDWVARVQHEACARWDRSGIPAVDIPEALASRNMALGTMTLESQFRSQIFARTPDVVVLSIQSDVTNVLRRHRREGWQFLDAGVAGVENGKWIADELEATPRLTPAESMATLKSLVASIRAHAPSTTILVYNMSPVVPGEHIDSYRGLGDAESVRIRRFNLALLEAAQDEDEFTIVDVEQIVARAGADRLKMDLLHYHRDGYRLVAAEVLRILEARGTFD